MKVLLENPKLHYINNYIITKKIIIINNKIRKRENSLVDELYRMVRTFICVNNYFEGNLQKKDIMYVMNVIVPSSKIFILNLNDSFGNSLKEDTNS